jgi:hypothetical protein
MIRHEPEPVDDAAMHACLGARYRMVTIVPRIRRTG